LEDAYPPKHPEQRCSNLITYEHGTLLVLLDASPHANAPRIASMFEMWDRMRSCKCRACILVADGNVVNERAFGSCRSRCTETTHPM